MATATSKARVITEEMIVFILTNNHLDHQSVADQTGIHPSTVAKIRYGRMHGTIRPDVPRWEGLEKGVSCWNCIHVKALYTPREDGSIPAHATIGCRIGLPDPLVHGAKFAVDCAAYLHKSLPASQQAAMFCE
jgi:hypothetical protein